MELRSVRLRAALAVVMLTSGLAVAALPATVAAAGEADSGSAASATAGAAIDYDHTFYTDHPQKCEETRREYARWAWVSECYRFGLSTWAFDYSCRIC
jgi:hypothetical protein